MQSAGNKSAYELEQAEKCQTLWQAVIERAFRDAIWVPTELLETLAELSRARIDAIVWLRGTTHGFFHVCGNAGINPGYVMAAAKRHLGEELYKIQRPRSLVSLRAEASFHLACNPLKEPRS